ENRRAAQTIAVAGSGTAGRAGGTAGNQPPAGITGAIAPDFRRIAQTAAGRIAADQPGARRKSQASVGAKERGRAEESPDRAGPNSTRRQSQTAGLELEIQIRISGQYVARASNAA